MPASAARRPSPIPHRRPRAPSPVPLRGLLPALLLPALLAAGCGGGAEGDGLPPSGAAPAAGPGSTAPTTSTGGAGAGGSLDSDERVLADYKQFWDAVVAAYATSDWRSARLKEHATGAQLDFLRNELLSNLTRGRVAQGRPRLFGAKVMSRDGDRAAVDDCIDSSRWLFHDAKTGQLVDAPSGKRYRVTATLRVEDRRWKVANVTYKEERCGA